MINKRTYFTLIEIIVTMAIFTVIMAGLMTFLKTVHTTSNISHNEKNMFENSRIAMDVISRDLHCIYYGSDSAPFWHWKPNNPPDSGWGTFSNELLAFVSTTPLPPKGVSSDLCEVKYQLYYTTDSDNELAGWLTRSVTGNRKDDDDNLRWNFNNNYDDDPSPNFLVGFTSNLDDDGIPFASFTANSTSSDDYQRLIPYVTNFEITCYDRNGTIINPDTQTSTTPINTSTQPTTTPAGMEFPYSIQVSITLMDRSSWLKWISIGGKPNNLKTSGSTYEFRKRNERTFTKTILIGDRGQYQ